MSETPCPFCSPDPSRVFFESDLVFGVWDAFAVSDGHALVVTRRHVASWFDATPAERAALTEGIAVAQGSSAANSRAGRLQHWHQRRSGGRPDDSTSPRPCHPPVQRRRSRPAWRRSPRHPGTRELSDCLDVRGCLEPSVWSQVVTTRSCLTSSLSWPQRTEPTSSSASCSRAVSTESSSI